VTAKVPVRSTADPWLLAIDTGTSKIVVGAGRLDGSSIGVLDWPAGYRHGELLLAGIEQLLAETGLLRGDIAGIVVGTGPGAFTGLRVGLATAKTMAHALRLPIVGVSTGEALLHAARSIADQVGEPHAGSREAGYREAGDPVLLLPAGPRDRVLVRRAEAPRLLPAGSDPDDWDERALVAVDLEGRAPAPAVRRGEGARDGLGAALLEIGAERLRADEADDVVRLVPEYVTLPRGIRAATGEIAWSRDPR
jgi:tRNA threonylcarbamoyl adenosine modification protein YeaZ